MGGVNTVAVTLALVGLVALLSIPPAGAVLDDVCRPQGFRAWVSSNISTEEFWRAQQYALKQERARLEEAPRSEAALARIAVLTHCESVIASR
jgi:hypothetical protein